MKKTILLILILVLAAVSAPAQTKPPVTADVPALTTPFEGDIGLGYRWVIQSGNPLAGEYEYLHPSMAGKAIIEYDPLPHRFLLDLYYQNGHDYYSEFDYSYADIIMLTAGSRRLFHNLQHVSFGYDDPLTASPSSVDRNPGDSYGTDDTINFARLRLKAPNFPFHVYLEARNQEKHGNIQQRFLRSFSGGFNRASETRDVDYETNEQKVIVNSHLGPLEVELSSAVKTFKNTRSASLADTTAITYDHNLTPELESTVNTIKAHTSHSGRLAIAATYSGGDRKNKESNTKVTFVNGAGDVTYIPTRDLTLSLKYRHYQVDEDAPSSVSDVGLAGPTSYPVKKALSTTRDTVSLMGRYRTKQSLVLRAEYLWDALSRTNAAAWGLDNDVTRNTLRLGATYRATNRLYFRGDVIGQTASVPGGSTDNTYPDQSLEARGLVTWVPSSWINALLSGGTVREERSQLGAPFNGSRTTERNRVLCSTTLLTGKKTAVTPSYAFFQNKNTQPLAYENATGAILSEGSVPYADVAHTAMLTVSHAVSDILTLAAFGGQTWSRGSWRNSGTVAGTGDIAELSDMKVVDAVAGADAHLQFTKTLGTDLRYQYRQINDILDTTGDGTNQIVMATLTYTW